MRRRKKIVVSWWVAELERACPGIIERAWVWWYPRQYARLLCIYEGMGS